jgi:hypothetical protein
VTRIGFYGRLWSEKKWKPQHLTDPGKCVGPPRGD